MDRYLTNIPNYWLNTNGLGTKVGIIDSGFDISNKYIKDRITKFDDYGSTDIDHGTHVLGIMCLDCLKSNAVRGLAKYSNYYLASIPMGQKNGMKYMCDALSNMISYGIDVLNMSFTNYMQNQTMKKLLFELHKRNTILISSYSQNLLFPHSYPFVISAGKQLITKNTFFSTISSNEFKSISGTSMQSAYISGVAAIAKAYDKKISKQTFMNIVAGKKMFQESHKQLTRNQINLKIKNGD